VNWGYKTTNKGAGLCDEWKVFFDASLTCSRVLLMVGDLAEGSSFVYAIQFSKCRGSTCIVHCFWRLIEPILMGQVRAVMAQTVRSSDFVLGSSCASLQFGLLVVAEKGVVSIDPLVLAVGPDQLNYGTQPKGAMILRREDRVCSLQVLSLESRPLTRPPAEEELAPPILFLTDDELVICGRDGLRGLTKPVEKSDEHDVRQNRVGIGTLKEFEEIMAESYLPSTTLRAWAAERVIEVFNRE
jgi:hypothetical protein